MRGVGKEQGPARKKNPSLSCRRVRKRVQGKKHRKGTSPTDAEPSDLRQRGLQPRPSRAQFRDKSSFWGGERDELQSRWRRIGEDFGDLCWLPRLFRPQGGGALSPHKKEKSLAKVEGPRKLINQRVHTCAVRKEKILAKEKGVRQVIQEDEPNRRGKCSQNNRGCLQELGKVFTEPAKPRQKGEEEVESFL